MKTEHLFATTQRLQEEVRVLTLEAQVLQKRWKTFFEKISYNVHAYVSPSDGVGWWAALRDGEISIHESIIDGEDAFSVGPLLYPADRVPPEHYLLAVEPVIAELKQRIQEERERNARRQVQLQQLAQILEKTWPITQINKRSPAKKPGRSSSSSRRSKG